MFQCVCFGSLLSASVTIPGVSTSGSSCGLFLPWSVERISGNAAAAQGGQGLRDGFVVAGPVGAQQGDVGGLKGLLHLWPIQSDALVDLAAQAPACGEVHKDRTALGLIAADGIGGPWLPCAWWQLIRAVGLDVSGAFADQFFRCKDSESDDPEQNQCGNNRRPALGRPAAKEPSGNGQQQEARQQRGQHAGSVSCGQHPGQPDDRGEDGHGDGLAQHLHPCAGLGQQARPGRLQGERDIGRGEAESERREDGKGDQSGLG